MEDRIIEKIIEKTGVSDLLNILGEKLTPQDWQSLLLAISAKRTDQVKPAQLLKAYENNRFVQPLKCPVRKKDCSLVDSVVSYGCDY